MPNNVDLLSRITVNQNVLAGKPIIRGMRFAVEQVLQELAAGATVDELLESYPVLERDDINACLLYAAEMLAEWRIYAHLDKTETA